VPFPTRLRLSFACMSNPRTDPLFAGDVGVEGAELLASRLHGTETFWRQLRFQQFDVSEMSLSSLVIATVHGGSPWCAIPVFPSRDFFHTWALVNKRAGIEAPGDLRGRRVGVPEYQQTAAVWSRGILEDEFGVAPRDVRWVMGRRPDFSHGSATDFEPPEGVELSYASEGDALATMLAEGRIDALLLYAGRNLLDRGEIDPRRDDRIEPLFPDVLAEARRYYAASGVYPINHTVVIRRSLAETHPWLPINLFQGFARAKRVAVDRLAYLARSYVAPGAVTIEPYDVMPYGLEANRRTLEKLLDYSYRQGLVPRRVALEEIFHESTLDLRDEDLGDAFAFA